MGVTRNFFNEKKPWSKYKDKLLDYYLTPYLQKIKRTGRDIVTVDCFAGKGKFDDGENGSPLIIADATEKLESYPITNYFIESKYYSDLQTNLRGYQNIQILQGTFEDNIERIINGCTNCNVFLYVDPYGIKSLNFQIIKDKLSHLNSKEMLLNLNSFGFIREACRILECENIFNEELLEDYEVDESNDISKMNIIFGGNQWKEIILRFKRKEIDSRQCEKEISETYVENLEMSFFKFVISMPITDAENHVPKYRMIYCTDYPDGLLIMNDIMNRTWERMDIAQLKGQQRMFQTTSPTGEIKEDINLKQVILDLVSFYEIVDYKDTIVELIQRYGILFKESDYRSAIRQLEKEGSITITRDPAMTPKGKPSGFISYSSRKKTTLVYKNG